MEMDYNLTDFGSYVSCDGYKKLRNDEPIDGASCICVESCLSFPFVTTSLITAKLKSWITSVSRVLSGPLSRHTHVGETLRETRSHQHVLKRKLWEMGARDVNNAWFQYFTLKRYYLGDNLFHQEYGHLTNSPVISPRASPRSVSPFSLNSFFRRIRAKKRI